MTEKPRLLLLDGLRGIAAILVLAYHHFEFFAMSDPMMPWINHGYLAVDFFFILSGFVIGYAYDGRWTTGMGIGQFFKRRIIRLHPMVIFATVLCMCTFYMGMGEPFSLIETTPVSKMLLIGLLSALMIPVLPSWDIRGWTETNPINGNAWTLYFEYFANIAYALVIRRFPKWLLSFFVFATAILTLDLTLDINMFGLLTEGHSAQAYTVIGGWSFNPEQTYIGLSRLLYPFFCGLLISRLGKTITVRKGGFVAISLFLVAILCMPRLGGYEHGFLNGIYEAIAILILFPILVMAGAGTQATGRSASICKWLGDISYPLYITHYGIAFSILQPWALAHQDATTSQIIAISIGSMLLSIFVAHAAFKLYDKPVRKWLSDVWKTHK